MNAVLNAAVLYRSLGFSVIPLKPHSKEPLIKWEEYQNRQPSEAEIKELFAVPNLNLGVITGSISRICVVDVDGTNGLAWIKANGLTSPMIALTGRGRQYFFAHSGQEISNSVKRIPEIDIRGDGGYVVAAPSIHPNGRRYTWTMPLTASIVSALPPFPTHLFQKKTTTESMTPNQKPKDWIADALKEMKLGNIDDTLFAVCSRLRADGYSPNDARLLLEPHAAKAGATPGHLEDKIRNVWERYQPNDRKQPQIRVGATVGRIHSPVTSRAEYERIKAAQGEKPEFTTGYSKVDQMCKGLRRQELFVLAARTGTGKTNWLLGTAQHLCGQGRKVLLFSTEMSFDAIWDRYRQALPDPQEFERHQFLVSDDFKPDLQRVEEALREVQPDVFMFDHINNVGEEHKSLGPFMLGLKMLARKFNIPGIVAAQLNRSADWVENGERVLPRMSMIKGSGTIEEASAQVLLLSEVKVGESRNEIQGNLDKSRYGEKGPVNFALLKSPYRMVETND